MSPISFPKAKRYEVPYHKLDSKRSKQLVQKCLSITLAINITLNKGVGFGYGKKVIQFQRSESPGPAKYNSSFATSSTERASKSPNRPKFGIGYEKFRLVSG